MAIEKLGDLPVPDWKEPPEKFELSRSASAQKATSATDSKESERQSLAATTVQSWRVKQGGKLKVDPPAPEGAAKKSDKKGLTSTLRRHFSTWDKDGDGFISRTEVDELIKDPSICGEAAVALCLLKVRLAIIRAASKDEWSGEKTGATLEDIAAIEREIVKGAEPGATLALEFDKHCKRLKNVNWRLFASGAPHAFAARQGLVGDCFFLAAVVGFAHLHPKRVREMVADNRDGTYTVAFPGQPAVKVRKPTPAEAVLGASAGADGLWFTVLEKAYMEISNSRGMYALFPATAASDTINDGGFLAEGIRAVTGHDADTDLLSLMRVAELRRELSAATVGRRIVTLKLRHELPFDEDFAAKGFAGGHAYTVLGFDEESDTVTIRNPWGSREPKGADGQPLDGIYDGIFTMSLSDIKKRFTTICFEQAE